ncbi:fumarylacetoacetate hydrolase family protein [Novosphingobium sp. Fuku2-ISO-50]|uniref:fumarylacetoacetate hydrolase family protein n=1 Tax=Novosphingobium sp. Fuku2-ISO-50 TaxID=1739114 RepID=UPI00076CA95D|nr:fumarylacetoacetate hydrolase family protein [Novosphingobium sp. Fuku2-ISO-50]KUR76762.1 4-oxalocrotonate decarboxylase [Novosphingobium sp. Fuku2-ISO-50]
MTLSTSDVAMLAERLDRAALERRAIAKITNEFPDMGWDDAYRIQDALRARIEARGADCHLLFKAGLTSRAKMVQMGVSEPVFGFLKPDGQVSNGDTTPATAYIHPRVEAEIAVRLKRPLKGPGCHVGDVLAAIDEVMVALEIIDSRYENFNFDLKSVIADNTSAAGWVLGEPVRFRPGMDLAHCGIVMRINDAIVSTVAGSAVLGHPAVPVAMLANLLAAQDREIPAGALILTGGASAACAVKAGDRVDLAIQGMGALSVHFS